MVIDSPAESATSAKKSVTETVESLRGTRMDESNGLECSSKASSPSQPSSGGPQKVGTYIIEKTIGKGNFSLVKLARHTVTNVKVAIKIIDKTKLNEENLKKAQREADILKTLDHPNIIKLYQVMESEKLLCIVTEYLPNGELYEYIAQNGYLSERVARHKFLEILSAVEHCHQNNVVHRDLKAENMLLDQHMSIKLADFGFGTFQPSGPSPLLTTWCGSPPYAAPEIFKGEPYLGISADIWSLGVILYVLVCGVLPFNATEVSCLRRQVLEEHVRVPYWLSMSCENLLKRMLAKTPSKRPSIREIYNSKWLSEINDAGPVPFPLSSSSSSPPDVVSDAAASSSCRLSVSLDAATTTAASQPHRSRSSVVPAPSPTLAADMKAGKLDETVIQIMENSGIDRAQLLESLGRCAYDHLTATYLLLGESLRRNRHSLSQTLVPRTEEIEVLRRQTQVQRQGQLPPGAAAAFNIHHSAQQQQQHLLQLHNYQQHQGLQQQQQQSQGGHARSSCPSRGVPLELLYQQQLTWQHQQHLQNQSAKMPLRSGGFMWSTPQPPPVIYPSSHPAQGFFLPGMKLPLVEEFSEPSAMGHHRRLEEVSPPPPPSSSPINLSRGCRRNEHVSADCSAGGGGIGVGAPVKDCFEGDWFPCLSERMASSSPTPVFSFGGELTPRQQSNQSVFGAHNLNALFGATPVKAEEGPMDVRTLMDLAHHPQSVEEPHPLLMDQQRRYSTASARQYPPAPAVAALLPLFCDPQHAAAVGGVPHASNAAAGITDEHTSGLGSSLEADSRHSSFSQPSAAAAAIAAAAAANAHFSPHLEQQEEGGIDIPRKQRISAHSPVAVGAAAASSSPSAEVMAAAAAAAAAFVMGCPRRKFGVSERPSALNEHLSQFQGVGGGGGGGPQPMLFLPHRQPQIQLQQPSPTPTSTGQPFDTMEC